VDTLTLTLAIFSVALCFFLRWPYSIERTRYLYAAFFFFGLSVSANPLLMPASLGIPFFVMFIQAAVARELFFAATVLSAAMIFGNRSGSFLLMGRGSEAVYFWIGVLTGVMWLVLVLKTRRLFTRWRQAIAAGLLALAGVAPYFYLPVASM